MEYKAVIIGVNEYVDSRGFPQLPCVLNDAHVMEQILRGSSCNYDTLTALTGMQATSNNILASLSSFFRDSKDDDILFLYWAGHGLHNSFITYNTDTERLANTSVKMKLIRNMIEQSNSETIVAIFDCCCSGGVVRREIQLPYLQILGSGKVIMTSCDFYQDAIEHKSSGHGLFTTYFFEGLTGQAALSNGEITVTSLFSYIYSKMKEETNIQDPVLNATMVGDIVLSKGCINH